MSRYQFSLISSFLNFVQFFDFLIQSTLSKFWSFLVNFRPFILVNKFWSIFLILSILFNFRPSGPFLIMSIFFLILCPIFNFCPFFQCCPFFRILSFILFCLFLQFCKFFQFCPFMLLLSKTSVCFYVCIFISNSF